MVYPALLIREKFRVETQVGTAKDAGDLFHYHD